MPIYETVCDHCGSRQEERRSMEEGPRKKCPNCGHKVRQEYAPPRLEVGGYSPMHPRKLRGNRGRR